MKIRTKLLLGMAAIVAVALPLVSSDSMLEQISIDLQPSNVSSFVSFSVSQPPAISIPGEEYRIPASAMLSIPKDALSGLESEKLVFKVDAFFESDNSSFFFKTGNANISSKYSFLLVCVVRDNACDQLSSISSKFIPLYFKSGSSLFSYDKFLANVSLLPNNFQYSQDFASGIDNWNTISNLTGLSLNSADLSAAASSVLGSILPAQSPDSLDSTPNSIPVTAEVVSDSKTSVSSPTSPTTFEMLSIAFLLLLGGMALFMHLTGNKKERELPSAMFGDEHVDVRNLMNEKSYSRSQGAAVEKQPPMEFNSDALNRKDGI